MNLVVSESHFVCFSGVVYVRVWLCEISNTHRRTLKSIGIKQRRWVGSCCCVRGEFVANVLAVHLRSGFTLT